MPWNKLENVGERFGKFEKVGAGLGNMENRRGTVYYCLPSFYYTFKNVRENLGKFGQV